MSHTKKQFIIGFIAVFCWPTITRAADVTGAVFNTKADWRFPNTSQVIDVTKPPYSARGDGKTDDTDAIQKALNDLMGQHKILYFPNGTYLVAKQLNWSNRNSKKEGAWGFNWIQGQNSLKTVIRLKDKTFTDISKPQTIMWCGGFGSADWFHNYVQGLTFDVGYGNPGAIGLQFYSNNTGAIRDVAIVSQDGKGQIGLDLNHRDMNGPLLVRNTIIRGFEYGVRTGHAVNSQTFEKITLTGQSRAGIENTGQAISIRQLKFEGAVTAVNTYGVVSILEANLIGTEGAKNVPAIVNYNGGRIALRDIVTSGYCRAVSDVLTPDYVTALRVTGEDKPGSLGPKVSEYFSHSPTTLFDGSPTSPRLPIEETPDVTWEDPTKWAIVDTFGADPKGEKNSSAAIQKAIDSGATTIFFPGNYAIEKPIFVRGKVRRMIGIGGWIDYKGFSRPDLVIEDGDAKTIAIEHFAPINGGIQIKTNRTVVLRSVEAQIIPGEKGQLFLEDVATSDLKLPAGKRTWARQLNIENEGTHITNDGSELWVLGYKTERGGTLLNTRGGGRSEIFGTISYTTTAGKLAPMIMTTDATAFAFFGEVCNNGDPFAVLVRESRNGVTREVKRGSGSLTPYCGNSSKK